MIMGRITAKSQTTIPRAVRTALGIGPGDTVGYEINGDEVTIKRVTSVAGDAFTNSFSAFTEWADEIDSAYDEV